MTSVEVDYENISTLRNKIKADFKQKEGFSLTFLPFISVATINALWEFPVVNSSFDLANTVHELHDFINLGIAVDLNREGLLVGTIKDSDSFNLRGLARKITEVSSQLRNKEYGLEEPWEGTPKFDTPTLLVDDLANSTMSLKICSDICRNYEIQKLNYAFVIVNKVNRDYYDMGLPEEQYSKSEHELRQKHDMYLDPNTTIISLFDMDEFNLKGASH